MSEPTNEIKQGKPKLRKLSFPALADVYIFDGDYLGVNPNGLYGLQYSLINRNEGVVLNIGGKTVAGQQLSPIAPQLAFTTYTIEFRKVTSVNGRAYWKIEKIHAHKLEQVQKKVQIDWF